MPDTIIPSAPPAIDTRVTRLLGIRYPIVQGGLAHIAYAELAAAVSNAGGLGQIITAARGGPMQPEELRAEIRRTRSLTRYPFAVNLPVSRFDPKPLLDVVVEEKVPAITLTTGNPAPALRHIEGSGVKSIVLTAGAELAIKAEAAGADMVATVGFEGGGHIGRSDETTMVMVPRVVAAVKIPVLASGGIADGRGMLAAFALGAEGVEMGTRFVATHEARAHEAYKQALLQAVPQDTMIIKASIGIPGRVVRTPYADKVLAAERAGASKEDVLAMVRGDINLLGVGEGRLDESFVWSGQCAGLIDSVEAAGDVVRRMAAEAAAASRRLTGYFA